MRSLRAPLAGCLACSAGLLFVALLVYGAGPVQRLDARVLNHFIAASGSQAESLGSAIVQAGDVPVLLLALVLACAIGLARGRPRQAVAALVVIAGANLMTQALKVLFSSHPRLQTILGAEQFRWDGFPSGHVTAVASIAVAFAFVAPRRLLPAVAVIGAGLDVAMGWAVLALNWHYPTDAVGAVFVVGAWGFAALSGLRALEGGRYRRAPQLGRRPAISVK
jgi:membrane-associated phospholipid phosphatase